MEDMDPISDGHTTIATTYKRWEHKLSNSVCTQEKKKKGGGKEMYLHPVRTKKLFPIYIVTKENLN